MRVCPSVLACSFLLAISTRGAAEPAAPASDQHPAPEGAGREWPVFAAGINVLEPLVYGIASAVPESSHLVTVPLQVHGAFTDLWGIAGTLLYRNVKDGDHRFENEVSFGVGPRVTFGGDGVRGGFATVKVGLGYSVGKDYDARDYQRLDLTLEPELGYAFAFGQPGFFLALGAGMRSLIPLHEKEPLPPFNWLGQITHSYIPVVDVTVGVDL